MIFKILKKILVQNFVIYEILFFHFLNLVKYRSLYIPKILCSSKKLFNKKVFIIGAGPSINNDIHTIRSISKDAEIFVSNYFVLTNLWSELKPRHYVLADPGLWNNEWDNTNLGEKNVELYSALNRVEWDLNLYIPDISIKFIKPKLQTNRNIHIFAFPTRSSYQKEINLRSNLIKKFLTPPKICNACLIALWISIMSNPKIISLYGLDSDGFKNLETDQITNEIRSGLSHFYDKKYIPEKKKKQKYLYQRFEQIYIMFREFEVLASLGRSKKITIKNLSSFSMLDNFDRK